MSGVDVVGIIWSTKSRSSWSDPKLKIRVVDPIGGPDTLTDIVLVKLTG